MPGPGIPRKLRIIAIAETIDAVPIAFFGVGIEIGNLLVLHLSCVDPAIRDRHIRLDLELHRLNYCRSGPKLQRGSRVGLVLEPARAITVEDLELRRLQNRGRT